jgi:eukaryotic-like serine/threonine-protein kinase
VVGDVRQGEILAGKYRVEQVLGRGGMGVVVAATHLALDQRVALKFMLPEAMQSGDATARFLREARAAVRLRSEHVARVLDVGTLESGAPYIVMEFLSGSDLAGLIEQRGPLGVSDAADFVLQACDAIAEAHSLGIVHRDLKPGNLFVARRPDGAPLVKVLDFGISKASSLGDAGVAMTKSSALLGSPLYMSPEQMKSSRSVDGRSDIWSLGVILYEIVGGRVPFDADTVGALMAKVLTEPPAPLRSVRPDLPADFCALVMKCLEADVSRRWQNVAELARALVPFASPGARALADRIAGVLRASSHDLAAAATALAADASEPARPVDPAPAVTAAAWGATAGGTTVRRSGRLVPLVLAGGVAAAALGGWLVLRARTASPASAARPVSDVAGVPAVVPVPSATAAPPASAIPPDVHAAAVDTERAVPAVAASTPPAHASAPAAPRASPAKQARPAGAAPAAPAPSPPAPAPKKKSILDDWN